MSHSTRPSRRAFAALAVASLALAACAGDDDAAPASTSAPTSAADTTVATTEAPATTEAASTTTADTTADTGASESSGSAESSADDSSLGGSSDSSDSADSGDDELILVESIEDMPQECQDLLVEFLTLIEPQVEGVDWSTATLGDFEDIENALSAQFDELNAREVAAGCDMYDLNGDDTATFEAIKELAEDNAPGAVEWLEFLAALQDAPIDDAELPTDCDGAIAYLEESIAAGGTMSEIPFSEINAVTQMLNTISTACSPDVSDAFFAREDVSAFLS